MRRSHFVSRNAVSIPYNGWGSSIRNRGVMIKNKEYGTYTVYSHFLIKSIFACENLPNLFTLHFLFHRSDDVGEVFNAVLLHCVGKVSDDIAACVGINKVCRTYFDCRSTCHHHFNYVLSG